MSNDRYTFQKVLMQILTIGLGALLTLPATKKKVDYITCFPSLERNLIFLKIPGRARFIDLNQSLFRLSSKEPLNISAMHDYTHSSKLIMKKG